MTTNTQAQPLVSVIIPAYNCATYLVETLDSIFSQGYANLEVIVINDGSKDNTLEIAKAYQKKLVVIDKQNEGPACARNVGLKAAKGKYISFLDSDDYWLPGKLITQVEYLENNPETGILYGAFFQWRHNAAGVFPEPKSFLQQRVDVLLDEEKSGLIYSKLLLKSMIHIITVLARKSVLDEVGFFREDLRLGEDYEYWIRASRQTRIDKLTMPMALYRMHNKSLTSSPSLRNYQLEVVEEALARWGTGNESAYFRKLIKKRLAHLAFRHGYMHFHAGAYCVARDSMRKSLYYQLGRIKGIIYYVLSILYCVATRPRELI